MQPALPTPVIVSLIYGFVVPASHLRKCTKICVESIKLHVKCPKIVCGWDSAPDPAGGAYDVPPDPLIGWGRGKPSATHVQCPLQKRKFSGLATVSGMMHRQIQQYHGSLILHKHCNILFKTAMKIPINRQIIATFSYRAAVYAYCMKCNRKYVGSTHRCKKRFYVFL